MGEAFINQKKGLGIKLNDVIEEFRYVYKGKNIKAGDFVNYINGVASKNDYGESVNTQLSSTAYAGYTISAVELDDNRIFITHSYGSSYYLYGMVVTINGATITMGTDTALDTTTNSGKFISTVLLPNGNIFIAHGYVYSGMYIYGMIITVNGTTISKGTDTQIATASYTSAVCSAILLPNGNVFIAHESPSSTYLSGIVCTISGTTISKGSAIQLSTGSYTGYSISTCLLDNGAVFIAHNSSTSYHLYGIVCTISGTTITAGSDTAIRAKYRAGQFISAVLLNGSQNSIFIAHSDDSSEVDYLYLYGTLVTVNGTTINVVVSKSLATRDTGYCVKALRLDENRVAIFHNYNSSSFYLGGVVAVINNNSITPTTDTQLSTTSYSGRVVQALLLNNNTIFVAHTYNSSYYLYSQIFAIDYDNNIPTNNIVTTEYEQQVTPAIEPPFNAVALSSGVGGTDTEHNEQVKIARLPDEEVV